MTDSEKPVGSSKDFEATLWNVFRNVNSWLEFAEKKNTILVSAFSLTPLLLRLLPGGDVPPDSWPCSTRVAIGLIGIGWLFSLISPFPKHKIDYLLLLNGKKNEKPSSADNLLFFGHIVRYGQSQYLEAVVRQYAVPEYNARICKDLAGQIVTNAEIACRKFTCFRRALSFGALGFAIGVIGYFT